MRHGTKKKGRGGSIGKEREGGAQIAIMLSSLLSPVSLSLSPLFLPLLSSLCKRTRQTRGCIFVEEGSFQKFRLDAEYVNTAKVHAVSPVSKREERREREEREERGERRENEGITTKAGFCFPFSLHRGRHHPSIALRLLSLLAVASSCGDDGLAASRPRLEK